MKYLLTPALAFVCAFCANAQIQITQANMPSISDTIRYSNAATGTFDFTAGGASYNWDFSSLRPASQDLYRFQALLSTPYATLAFTGMPAGAIGYKVADSIGAGQAGIKNIYNFYEKKTSGWSAVGTGFTLSALPIPAGGVYSDKDEIYLFPLKYNDYDSSTFMVNTPLGNQFLQLGSFKQKGYRINRVDGWGSISTPYGSNISCLRVKSTVVETDSLKITTLNLNVGFPANRVEYRWLSTTEKIPVLEVTGTEIAGIFTPSAIRYRDRYRTIDNSSPLAPRARFSANKYSGIAGRDSFLFSNLSSPNLGNTYQWTFTPSAGIRYINGSSATSASPALVFDSAGVYTVKLSAGNFSGSDDTVAQNCISISKSPSSANHTAIPDQVLLYPNPAGNTLYLSDTRMAGMSCRIFDPTGKMMMQAVLNADLSISIDALPAGTYSLLITGGQTIYVNTFTKY